VAKALKMSRTPVREALLMLEHEKLLLCDDGLGFRVRRLKREEVEEYFAIREVIEDHVLSLLVKNITEEDLAEVRREM